MFLLALCRVYERWDSSLEESVLDSESVLRVEAVDGTGCWGDTGLSWEASYRGGSLSDETSPSGLYGGGGKSNHGGRLASRTACEYDGGESRETPDG